MDTQSTKFSRFDQVKIVTVRNVHYLSAPPGSVVSPKGVWQVSAAIGDELLLVKGNATIKIPVTDVLKVVDYNVNAVTAKFGRLSEYGQERKVGEEDDPDPQKSGRTSEGN